MAMMVVSLLAMVRIFQFQVLAWCKPTQRNRAWEDLYHNLIIHGSINTIVAYGSADYRIEVLESKS